MDKHNPWEQIRVLQACVKEMEMEHAIWEKHSLCELVKENARLRKALEGLTNAALAGIKPLPSQVEAGFEALRELDANQGEHREKKCDSCGMPDSDPKSVICNDGFHTPKD